MKHICEITADDLPEIRQIELFDEDRCPVWEAHLAAEQGYRLSCGKGAYCRDGIWQLSLILSDITHDKSGPDDPALLHEICKNILLANDCQVAVRVAEFVRASAENHPGEWDNHLHRKRCTAMTCPGFFTVLISPDQCTGCGVCIAACPARAITGGENLIHVVDQDACTRCGECFDACPDSAIIKAGQVRPRVPEAPVPVGSFAPAPQRRRRRRRE
jgi:NADH-quinone oxidoreductase subunit F